MRTMNRRLRRLEDQLVPWVNLESFRTAALLRERRRRRLEACGEPVEAEPPVMLTAPRGGFLTIAETLRSRFRQRAETRQA